jgi:SAM-dependent methyltransferase
MSENRPERSGDQPFSSEYFKPWVYHPTSMYWWSTRYYMRLVTHYCRGGRLLEVGCGLGHLLGMFDGDFDTYCVDISEYAVHMTHENAPRAHVLVAKVEGLAMFPAASFDVLIAKHVVEHLPDPPGAFQEFARLLKPGGLFIFGTPNTESALRGLKGERWYALHDRTHISLKPPGDWASLTRASGLRVVKMIGDGLWDVPYLPVIPTSMQRAFFGLPAALQVLTGTAWMPVSLGESVIVIARK